jgi:endonuclease/exonuclease/phosphatase family metal-dependent hydrolase
MMLALLIALSWPKPCDARHVRVATFNVENGVGSPDSAKYKAIRDTLRRVDADIVAFQEITPGSEVHWRKLAAETGYPHVAKTGLGPFSGDLFVGFFSRFPIREQHEVHSPPGAMEIARWPLCVLVEVPGAARPLVLWTVHHKAMFGYADCFRRAVEARRLGEDIAAHLRAHTNHVEYIVLGDMNDDFEREDQPGVYSSLPHRLSSSYRLGSDIVLPLKYRIFPLDHYQSAGLGMRWVPAFRAGTTNRKTHLYTDFTLDYIFVSLPVWSHPDGPPRGEVYHSQYDHPGKGLPKKGNPLPPETSLSASDHYPVFADLHLEDAAP